jgi:hypothetical protein
MKRPNPVPVAGLVLITFSLLSLAWSAPLADTRALTLPGQRQSTDALGTATPTTQGLAPFIWPFDLDNQTSCVCGVYEPLRHEGMTICVPFFVPVRAVSDGTITRKAATATSLWTVSRSAASMKRWTPSRLPACCESPCPAYGAPGTRPSTAQEPAPCRVTAGHPPWRDGETTTSSSSCTQTLADWRPHWPMALRASAEQGSITRNVFGAWARACGENRGCQEVY